MHPELAHQERWYATAIEERFFEREGFRRLVDWNLAALRRAVPFDRSMTVVSLGCGLADYELRLARDVRRVIAADLSSHAIAEARARAAQEDVTNIELSCAPVSELDIPAGSVDVVYALGLLHHLDDRDRQLVFERARSWLRPGGWFYARDPSARGLLRRFAGMAMRLDSRFHSPQEEALDPLAVAAAVGRAGFHDVRVDYTDVLAGPLPWLVKSSAPLLWRLVFAFDRLWLATPGLRRLASQFSVTARR